MVKVRGLVLLLVVLQGEYLVEFNIFFLQKNIANSASGFKKAETRLKNARKPLRTTKNLANAPFGGANITRTIGQTVGNYNNAYSSYVLAAGTNAVVKKGMEVVYFLLENLASDLIGLIF